MNSYITGAMIKELREQNSMTQSELAERLGVSDKAVSKWETGRGYPDITLFQPIADVFQISVVELLSGAAVTNTNVAANMLRSRFYVCPVCGNTVHSMGQSVVSCHGIVLPPLEAEEAEGKHEIVLQKAEDEYFVFVDHEMTKEHYISFLAAVSSDRVQIVKLYPEGNAEARFKISGVRMLYFYCNRDGLFRKRIK
ncbi:MAG: helix-turn-helix domain-containing protein [Lachnospiraceae bacterium]|nr:helix-turn-helix domain-containing protein [Lachnospiraceae bacterium]